MATDAERRNLIRALDALQRRLDDHVDATVETLTKDYTRTLERILEDVLRKLPREDGKLSDSAVREVLPAARRELLASDGAYQAIAADWLKRLDQTAEQVREGIEAGEGRGIDFTRSELEIIAELKGQWPTTSEPGSGLAGRFFSLTDTHRRALADAVTRAVLGRRKEGDLVAELDKAVGKDGRDARWLLDDGTMQFSRSVHLRKADELGYEWFLYVGPQDAVTRPFCSPLVDTVHTREEIDDMDNRQTGAGTVMVAGGGYRCRHHWRAVRPEWYEPDEWAAMGGSVDGDQVESGATEQPPEQESVPAQQPMPDPVASAPALQVGFDEIARGPGRTYFHGSVVETLSMTEGMDLNLTRALSVAQEYAVDRRGTYMHAVDISSSARIAGEDDLWRVAERVYEKGVDENDYDLYDDRDYDRFQNALVELDDWKRENYVYELADDRDIREALAEEGFDGVEYMDLSPDNQSTHDTVRIWNPQVVERHASKPLDGLDE